ncbi:DUF461 domain-containing protein [Kitasatospora sp. NPDC052896]|uniref:DUF461 domain-containing protein n=1 Tax=Kitasatospora sp. NPDC052896 TaxID=3364061 RepID=UPI0037CBC412
MSRSLRRGGSAAIVLALATVSLSACSAGQTAETQQIKPNTPAVTLGNDLRLNSIVVVTAPDATPDAPGPATVTLSISNTGSSPETLQSITVNNTAATLEDATGATVPSIVVPAGGAVSFGSQGQPSAHLASIQLPVGGFTPTSFTFDTAGSVSAQAQVSPATGYLASYGPVAPSASASTSASGSPTASGSPSPSAGASASGSAVPSATASASAPGGTAAGAGASATASATAH